MAGIKMKPLPFKTADDGWELPEDLIFQQTNIAMEHSGRDSRGE